MTTKSAYKLVLMAFWLTIVTSATICFISADLLGLTELLERLESFIELSEYWASFTYIEFYSLRSLFFFPASVLVIIAGILPGPWFGLIFTIIGENISTKTSTVLNLKGEDDHAHQFQPSPFDLGQSPVRSLAVFCHQNNGKFQVTHRQFPVTD